VSEIALQGVWKSFGGRVVVQGLSLSVARGEIVAIVGKTGAGKSTALHMIMGVFPPDRGTIRVTGLDPYRDFARLRGRLAVSFQTDRLLPWRRAAENVALGLQILGVERGERERRAREWLARVKMTGSEDKYPHELSGGMRQRVSFARALAVDPAIVLLDESFSQLDEVTSRELRRDFAELVRSLGKTSLLVTHRLEEALEMAERVVVLGAPARILTEVRTEPGERSDPGRLAELRRRVAEAMDAADDGGAAAGVERGASTGR
jgi:NitT/TauT family transport system ATP-binding protein